MPPKLGPFCVLVRELPTKRHFDVGGAQVAAWVDGHPMRDALGAPSNDPEAGHGSAELELYADGTHAFAAGSFAGELVIACSRCVGPVRLTLAETIRVTFLPAQEMPSDDEDDSAEDQEGAEVSAQDLDVFAFDGEVIDLEPVLREQFVLAIPFAPLCRETCQGLCPQCGIDRNTSTCTCTAPTDPRLAGLKGLKLPS